MKTLNKYILEKFHITKDSKYTNPNIIDSLDDLVKMYHMTMTNNASTSATKRYQLLKTEPISDSPICVELIYNNNVSAKGKFEKSINDWFKENFSNDYSFDPIINIIIPNKASSLYGSVKIQLTCEVPKKREVYTSVLSIIIKKDHHIFIEYECAPVLHDEFKIMKLETITASMLNYIANYVIEK